MQFKFKKDVPDVQKRKQQCNILLIKEPDKVPVIIEKDPSCKLEPMKSTKHLIMKKFTVNKLLLMIKNILKLDEGEALFLAAKGKYNIMGEQTMGEVYTKFKDKEDNFLYIAYSSELVYG